jgi:hypothetical protein
MSEKKLETFLPLKDGASSVAGPGLLMALMMKMKKKAQLSTLKATKLSRQLML